MSEQNRKSNKKLVTWLSVAVIGMFGFGFALVPLYDIMCEALGINGKTNTVSAVQPVGMRADISRTIRVEFMAHINPDMPWTFKPETIYLDVHPGEVIQTAYLAKNNASQSLIGQAVPSVSPGTGAAYFNKIECFCFNHQPLDANGEAEMPLIFYIEPDIPESIHTLTLSYTLYNITSNASVQDAVERSKGSKSALNRELSYE
ncbi:MULTISPECIES: cytochrome c oxidase assembly protein [Vibrio]|jgi:cytochrome c oxidase assembly protein subunit 11|uniref:Cytochrome c oxidase assembly protein CtaG n=1 Tax=Vibrio mediterranei TaxID=689 RepID=A0A241TA64_9VIBR|nr:MULTISPECIES: cytochrome c oxidase assembly protein [Vibrio]ASI92121.1 cytochrome c oxidase assembly protein [Vibrio mediterranei]AYV24212.1 cytochrome c oxidase assembly protein [Vibrio mediterranei]EDL55717.1 cytochrome C oxidase assembly protein [Vibrio mediterranei AK1]MCF4173937.1 cytochrome c oxidase assembly protein [Vibrio sp. McD22-P3]MCG9789200.1 cytochrome c oxidase assembly protein [Vibrio mediterranei]